ncbi:MAG: hypothetical protein AAF990_04450 [Bacteroidota bacterium]
MKKNLKQKVNGLLLQIIEEVLNSDLSQSVVEEEVRKIRIEDDAARLIPPGGGRGAGPSDGRNGDRDSSFFIDDIVNGLERYWTDDPHSKKMFIIPFTWADELVEASPIDQLALRVENIEDPLRMSANWVGYDEDKLEDERGDVTFFLIPKRFFEPGGQAAKANFKSIESKSYEQLHITAQIGRNEAGNTVVYMIVGAVELIFTPEGDNPAGATSGAKIPP